jgi:excisionase family DNA binding protein
MQQLLTLSQMADDLGCSVKTFAKDVREKQIPFVHVGKRMKFDPVIVKAHLTTIRQSDAVKRSASRVRARVSGRGKFSEALGL